MISRVPVSVAIPHPLQVTSPSSGGTFQVTMLPGDGVGPELMHAVKEVFKVRQHLGGHEHSCPCVSLCPHRHRGDPHPWGI
uniref:Uncharacterized protein n=1 Tax=Malurus cyaneus samueli TaxID=2593467 RepID=A0A8C5X6P4_9PASS